MSNVPGDLKYTTSHEWVRVEGDIATMGITDHAQDALGDLVFVETPDAGSTLSKGDACAVVESVKAASDVYAPISGEVTEVNEALADAPELINEDAYGSGWICKLRIADAAQLEALLPADAYTAVIEAE